MMISPWAANPTIDIEHGLLSTVRLAREFAVMGNYTTAIEYYKALIPQLSKYRDTMRDVSVRTQWGTLVDHVAHELQLSQQLQSQDVLSTHLN